MMLYDRTTCPLHREPCPPGCDYWTKSDVITAKVAAGICCCTNCNYPASVGEICATCHERIQNTEMGIFYPYVPTVPLGTTGVVLTFVDNDPKIEAVYKNPDPQATDALVASLAALRDAGPLKFECTGETTFPEPAPGHLDGCVNFGTFHLCDATCPLLRAGHPKCFSGMGG